MVVCTRDRVHELKQCVESLSQVRERTPFELVIVDNGSSGSAVFDLAEQHAAVCVAEPVPGLSRARNRGVRASTGDIVAFIDDDARPDPAWLPELAREFEDPEVMAATGRTLPLTVETDAQKLYDELGGYDRRYNRRMVFDRHTPNWFEMSNFGGIGTGGNMAFRREAFRLWPGFDERLGRGAPIPGNEEHHAFFSLISRGGRVAYTPAAIVRHPFPSTWDEFREQQLETLGCGFGYMAFLFENEPEYRGPLLRFALRRFGYKVANWRHVPDQYRRLVPFWRQVPAMLRCALRSLGSGRPARTHAFE